MTNLKPSLLAFLKRVGLYHRLRTSQLHEVYWMVAGRSSLERRRKETEFYRGLLNGFRHDALVFDIGANAGEKTELFLRLGARVVAVEPDNDNQEIIRNKFLRYRIGQRPVVVLGKAVSDRTTIETMWIDAPGSAFNTLSQKWVETLRCGEKRFGNSQSGLDFKRQRQVETITIEQMVMSYGTPFFIKIDVEGYEPTVLRGMRSAVPYLSFEVNLPYFRPEGLECVAQLDRLAAHGRFNYTADCEQGLVLEQWLPAPKFSEVLEQCSETSIEVFWRT